MENRNKKNRDTLYLPGKNIRILTFLSSGSPPKFPSIIDKEWQVAIPLSKVEGSGSAFNLDNGS